MDIKRIVLILFIIISSMLILYKIKLWYIDDVYNTIPIENIKLKEDKEEINKNEATPVTDNHQIKLENRLNILILGIEEDPRSDTIIFATFNLKSNKLDIISIPRDTYYYVESHPSGDHRKINAAYVREREEGTLKAVEEILDIKIDNYIAVKYEAVEKIVNIIGGVEVEVPTWITELPSGNQLLNGEESVIFVRSRKGYYDGDIGRIKAQQKFIKSALTKILSDKSLAYNIPSIIKDTYKLIDTDMKTTEIISYSLKLKDIKSEDINTYILPGYSKLDKVNDKNWWYYYYDEEETKELINKILMWEDDTIS